MSGDFVSAAEFKRRHKMGHRKFVGLIAAGRLIPETIPGVTHPVFSVARYEASERRRGELDAERSANAA